MDATYLRLPFVVTDLIAPLSWSLLLLPLFGFYLVLFPGAVGYALFARHLTDYLDRGAYGNFTQTSQVKFPCNP